MKCMGRRLLTGIAAALLLVCGSYGAGGPIARASAETENDSLVVCDLPGCYRESAQASMTVNGRKVPILDTT